MAKRKSNKADTGSNASFEAKLWAAADALRNNMDAAEYKHVVLGLISLKYISDAFDSKSVDPVDDVAALREVAREFEAAFNGGDVGRLMRFYGERYVDVNLRDSEQSRSERREYFVSVIHRGALRIAVQPNEIPSTATSHSCAAACI